MSEKNFLTPEGKKRLEKELHDLITVDREKIKKKIAEARALGDLKENAEYHAAKESQSLLEGKIAHLQQILGASEVVDVSTLKSDRVVFGMVVTLFDLQKEKEFTYQIVGEEESDRAKGRISYRSPLGMAVLGKREGEMIMVKAPKGDLEFEILSLGK